MGGAQGVPIAPPMIDTRGLLQAFEGFIQLQQQTLRQQQQLQAVPHVEILKLDQFLHLSPPCFKGRNDPEAADF